MFKFTPRILVFVTEMGHLGLGDYLREKRMAFTRCSVQCWACFLSGIWGTPNSHLEPLDHREGSVVGQGAGIPPPSLPWSPSSQRAHCCLALRLLPTLVSFQAQLMYLHVCPFGDVGKRSIDEPGAAGRQRGRLNARAYTCKAHHRPAR